MQMPFGRYKSKEISAIPPDYLKWICDNLTISGDLANEIYEVLGTGPDPEHIQRCRAALAEMASDITDKQVMQLYGYAEWILSPDRED
ncbi:MAG: DUF3820 family protein [Thermoguttaceae bacterium]